MRTTPRVILTLKQASAAARLHKTLAQNLAMTGPLHDHTTSIDKIQRLYMSVNETPKIRRTELLQILH